jgi:hypothetical protein
LSLVGRQNAEIQHRNRAPADLIQRAHAFEPLAVRGRRRQGGLTRLFGCDRLGHRRDQGSDFDARFSRCLRRQQRNGKNQSNHNTPPQSGREVIAP